MHRIPARPGAPGRPLRSPRGTLAALAAVFAALAAFGVWSAQMTKTVAARATNTTRLSDAYASARFAVGEEESLERKYRLEPGRVVRAKHAAAARELQEALRTVARDGSPEDRALIRRLAPVHDRYLGAIDRMFRAVDAGQAGRVLAIDAKEIDPLFGTIEEQVDTAAGSHRAAARRSLASLTETERFAAIGMPIAFALGLALLGLVALQLSQLYRRLRQQADENEHNALHDSLTGLPNRALFSERLAAHIERSESARTPFSLLMIDLDRFKEINDTLGHSTGDRLLCEIGPRLRSALRADDSVARLGGDEFAVLLPSADSEVAGAVAERILRVLGEPFALAELSVTVDASIGLVSYPAHGTDAEALVQRGDVAMYLAKDRGRGHALYDPDADPYNQQRLALVGDLRGAIAQDALQLHYQPKYTTGDLRISSVEALVRWNHPEHGMISPGEFIPLAEHTGLIKPLTLLVLRQAARQCHAWNEMGLDLSVAVNLSVANLADTELVADVAAILDAEGLSAERLELEITESMVMTDPERATAQLNGLAAMGIRLAIDDFGTGHSSLAYLRRLPVRELKIDRSFVRDLASDEDDAAIVRSTIELAHSLGLTVVAEGVEDAEALALLRRLGCDHAQGFHLCRPRAPQELLDELYRGAAGPAAVI